MSEATRAAERMLDGIWSELAGGRVIPVDPVRICLALGFDVFEAELDPEVAGALVKEPDQDPIILLNRSDHKNRQRFTCAHELGHFVMRSDENGGEGLDQYEFVDARGTLAALGTDKREVFANQFAASLLMPENEIRGMVKSLSSVELAWHFQVSQDAMNYRLRNLRLGSR